jgi:hypothetical protein
LLYEIVDPQAGRRTYVPLKRISPYLIAATIATEDKNFYAHPGFDPVGIVRAIWQNTQSGETVSGASTITQQLVRALVLSPEERAQRTNMRKIREIILAAEIERTYTKDEILELYLNEIYYGNLAYGIEPPPRPTSTRLRATSRWPRPRSSPGCHNRPLCTTCSPTRTQRSPASSTCSRSCSNSATSRRIASS